MASHPTQNYQKMQLKMHQHYRDSNGAKYRDIDSDELSRYIAISILSLSPSLGNRQPSLEVLNEIP